LLSWIFPKDMAFKNIVYSLYYMGDSVLYWVLG
jgi:hypothetical protein